MMTIWLKVFLCLPCCLIISLLTLMYLYRNNLFQLRLFHIEDINQLTRRLFLLICDSLLWFWIHRMMRIIVDLYDSTLRDIVDEYSPLRTKEMPSKPMLPYRRYCERLWIRTSLCVDFEMFKVSKILVNNTLASAKSEHYNRKIKASKGNQRTVFSVVNKVLHKSQTVLPNIHSGFQSSTL